jgi:hypothetical protein
MPDHTRTNAPSSARHQAASVKKRGLFATFMIAPPPLQQSDPTPPHLDSEHSPAGQHDGRQRSQDEQDALHGEKTSFECKV